MEFFLDNSTLKFQRVSCSSVENHPSTRVTLNFELLYEFQNAEDPATGSKLGAHALP
jgi:hypothetical protein